MSAQQDVIKHFMGALDKTPLSGTAAVDSAVRACSDFGSLDELIDRFIADCENAESGDAFLKDYCGIDLDNDDTGAITGFDAGGDTVKTKDSIVEESGEATYPESTSFVINGLTVNIPEQSDLTEKQQAVVRGLYSWWMGGALDLIAESYGDRFGFGEESSATTDEIDIEFVTSGAFLAQVGHKYKLATGKATKLVLQINMKYYDTLIDDDVNGASTRSANYLDRTLAHELTHAVMAANVTNFNALPAYVKEGVAELTHGVDDTRKTALTTLAGDSEKLRAALTSSSSTVRVSGVTAPTYAAGYMLLRYLAKQSAATIADKPENYSYVELTDGDDSLDNYEDELTLALGGGNDTIKNYAEAVTIIGGDGDARINRADLYQYTGGNDTLTSYSTGDSIQLLESTLRKVTVEGSDLILYVGDGSIDLKNAATKSITLIDRAGELSTKNYSAATLDGGNDVIICNADGLKLNRSKTKLTIGDPYSGVIDGADFSSRLKTLDARKCGNEVELIGNANNNVLRAGSGGSTLWGGFGNDKLYGGSGADVFVYDGGKDRIFNYASEDRIVLDDWIDEIKISGKNVKFMFEGGSLTIKKAVGTELALTDADGNTNQYIFDRNHKTLETALVTNR